MNQNHRPPPLTGKAWQHLSLETRFAASYTVNAENDCWEWLKPGSQGYGGIDVDGKTIAASRASWTIHRGVIPNNLCVLHKCDNRRCVNPDHLYLGDKKQNRKDFMERHPRAKELVKIGADAAAKGSKRFWDSMTEEQRKEFCTRRAASQAAKRGVL